MLKAIIEAVADEFTYTPDQKTTPERIREIVGAPEDPEGMQNWRTEFWDGFRSRHQAD